MATQVINGQTYTILPDGLYKPFGADAYYELSGGSRRLIGNRSQLVATLGESALDRVQEVYMETIVGGSRDGGAASAVAATTAPRVTGSPVASLGSAIKGFFPGSGDISWSFGAGNPIPIPLILAVLALFYLFFRK